MLEVVEAAHIVHAEDLQDVANADRHLHVRLMPIDGVGTLGELIKHVVGSILQRIVLVGQLAPNTAESDVLTQFQLLEERNTVEDLAVHIPRH